MTSTSRPAAKRPINLSLTESVVLEARAYTSNLSATLDGLLAEFVARERDRHRRDRAGIDRVIGALDAVHAQHGLLSDEFSGL